MGSFDSLELTKSASIPICSESNRVLRKALSTILEDGENASWSDSWISVEELSTVNSLTTTLNAAEAVMDGYFGERNTLPVRSNEQENQLRDRESPVKSCDDAREDLDGRAFGSARSIYSSNVVGDHDQRTTTPVEAEESSELIPRSEVVSTEDAQPSLRMARSWASAPSKLAQAPASPRHRGNVLDIPREIPTSKTATSDASLISRAKTTTSRSLDTIKALEWKLRMEKVKAKLRKRVAEKQKNKIEESTLPTIGEDREDPALEPNTTKGLNSTGTSSTSLRHPSSSSLESETTGSTSDSWQEEDSHQMNISTISIRSQAISKLSSIQSESALADSQTFLSSSSQISSFSDNKLEGSVGKKTIPLSELQEVNFRSFSSEEDVILTNISSKDLSWTQPEPREQVITGMDQVQAQANSNMNLIGVMVLESEDKVDGKLVNAILSDQSSPHICTIETTLVDMHCVDDPNDADNQQVDCSAALQKLVEGQEKTEKKRGWRLSSVTRKFRDRVAKGSNLLSS